MLPDTGGALPFHSAVRRHRRTAAIPSLRRTSAGPRRHELPKAFRWMRADYATLPDPFPMWRGGELRDARIAYETWGKLNAARDNAILLFTGLSPSAHARSSTEDPSEGWWEEMVGPGLAIDTNRYYVICVNSLGSCFGSTGPASDEPGNERAVPHELSRAVGGGHRARRLRNAALARHRTGGRGHRPLARRHGSARVRRAVSGRRSPPGQHLRHARPLRRSPSRCARFSARPSCAIRTGPKAATPASARQPPACASRASWE